MSKNEQNKTQEAEPKTKLSTTISSSLKNSAQKTKKRSREIYEADVNRASNDDTIPKYKKMRPQGLKVITQFCRVRSKVVQKRKNNCSHVLIISIAGGKGVKKEYINISDQTHCEKVVKIMRTAKKIVESFVYQFGIKVTIPTVRLYDKDFIITDKAEGTRLDKILFTKKELFYLYQALKTAISLLNKSTSKIYHNDLHARNLFWCSKKKLLTIIDFDEATVGFRNSKSNFWFEYHN